MKKIILILMILSNIIFAKNASPYWFQSGELQGYPKESFFIGVGEGQDYDEAIKNAQSFISSQIKINIETKSIIMSEQKIIGDQSDYVQLAKNTINSSTEEVLKGVEIIKKEVVEKRYFVFLVLDKNKYLKNLSFELDNLLKKINEFQKNGEKLISSGEIFLGIESYSDAQNQLEEFLLKQNLYNAISNKEYTINSNLQGLNLNFQLELRKILSDIKIEVLEGDFQIVENGKEFPKMIKVLVKYKNIGLSNFPLSLYDDEGKISKKIKTNSNGIAEFNAKSSVNLEKNSELVLKVDIYRIPLLFREQLKKLQIVIKYLKIQGKSFDVSVNAFNENGYRIESVIKNINKKMIQAGNQINDYATNRILVELSTIDSKEINTFNGTQYIVEVKADFYVETIYGKKYIGINKKVKGVHTKSKEKAIENAYEKIELNAKETESIIYTITNDSESE